MTDNNDEDQASSMEGTDDRIPAVGIAIALAALTVVGAGLAILQTRERRLSKLEIARLKFYRYLREKGHLES